MGQRIYIGVDNGVTGTIGVVGNEIQPQIYHTPTKKFWRFKKCLYLCGPNAKQKVLRKF